MLYGAPGFQGITLIGGICYHVLNRGNDRQDVFHDDDDHGPHGPGIHATTPLKPTNRGKKVECPLFQRNTLSC